MAWQHVKISIPASVIAQANRLAYIIDPDTGGDKTFRLNASADGSLPQTHCLVGTAITDENLALIRAKTPSQWAQALSALASQRGRAAPRMQDCTDLAAVIKVGDEVTEKLAFPDP